MYLHVLKVDRINQNGMMGPSCDNVFGKSYFVGKRLKGITFITKGTGISNTCVYVPLSFCKKIPSRIRNNILYASLFKTVLSIYLI